MLELFLLGGPVMWPLLLLSLASVSITAERVIFWFNYKKLFDECKKETDLIIQSHDSLDAKELLEDRLKAHVKKTVKGLKILDTVVTVAPLLGILGTVTGMISSFRVLSASPSDAPRLISFGISEALITTAFGLVIAILAVIPFNYFSHRAIEEAESISSFGTSKLAELAGFEGEDRK